MPLLLCISLLSFPSSDHYARIVFPHETHHSYISSKNNKNIDDMLNVGFSLPIVLSDSIIPFRLGQ